MSVSLSKVRKSFGTDAAVASVSIDIEQGEFFAVLGPSGCGKSTLLRLIAGLETLDGGEISIGDKNVAGPGLHVPPEERNVGVVFQSYALWPHMLVRDNVAFPIETAGQSKKAARQQAETYLETVALTSYAGRKPAELSGGQRQRVALARCLAQRAKTILMDEPLANLDPHLRGAMEAELSAFHASNDATTLYITHDQAEAMALADRVAIMSAGRILQAAAPEVVYRRPANEEVARFVGHGAIVDARMETSSGDRAHIRIGDMSLDAGCNAGRESGACRVIIRPEDIAIDANSGNDVGRVVRSAYRGGFWEAEVSVEFASEPLVVNLPDKVRIGDELPIRITDAFVLGTR